MSHGKVWIIDRNHDKLAAREQNQGEMITIKWRKFKCDFIDFSVRMILFSRILKF